MLPAETPSLKITNVVLHLKCLLFRTGREKLKATSASVSGLITDLVKIVAFLKSISDFWDTRISPSAFTSQVYTTEVTNAQDLKHHRADSIG